MSQIVDRRENPRHKSAVNSQRFLKRYRSQVREAVREVISGRKIADVDRDAEITIPKRDLNEPTFHHGQGGRRTGVLPGNKEYVTGDEIERPKGGGKGQGSGASDDGEGEDAFRFTLSREEFLDMFFEDMALPDLVKTRLATMKAKKTSRAGYTTVGTPSNLAIVRSMRESLARRIVFQGPHKRRLKELEARIVAINDELARMIGTEGVTFLSEENEDDNASMLKADILGRAGVRAQSLWDEQIGLLDERKVLLRKIDAVPFIDTFDLRFRNRVAQPQPIAQAVMFCIMDVSGSMDETRKDLAKRFFILLHLFLKRHYERIDLVFIRHHTTAKECDEEEFFHSTETGGTVVSSSLDLMLDIAKERYPLDQWNIYVAQASDGDNWEGDSPKCLELLLNKILPIVQYMVYTEITTGEPQNLWRHYEQAKAARKNINMGKIRDRTDIYPVLRELFAKKESRKEAA